MISRTGKMLMLDTPATTIPQIADQCAEAGLTKENGELIGAALAKAFSVQLDEVALLVLTRSSLNFVYPAKLKQVGSIPLNNTNSVAARTANTKRAEALNNFSSTKHASVFEAVKLNSAKPPLIQKMMSAPVIGQAGVVGVIQISRKGSTPQDAGADFTAADVQRLLTSAGQLAK